MFLFPTLEALGFLSILHFSTDNLVINLFFGRDAFETIPLHYMTCPSPQEVVQTPDALRPSTKICNNFLTLKTSKLDSTSSHTFWRPDNPTSQQLRNSAPTGGRESWKSLHLQLEVSVDEIWKSCDFIDLQVVGLLDRPQQTSESNWQMGALDKVRILWQGACLFGCFRNLYMYSIQYSIFQPKNRTNETGHSKF